MVSDALSRWNGDRSRALDSLDAVHGKVTGRKAGRQYATQHYNLTMYVALAAEFQGYCRDLHDDVAIALVDSINFSTNALAPVLLSSLTRARKLDMGNAHPGSLGTDFGIVGMDFWGDLKAAYPRKAPTWNAALEHLNKVRNAVAHSDEDKLAAARLEEPLTLQYWRKRRKKLDEICSAMDSISSSYLTTLTGQRPW